MIYLDNAAIQKPSEAVIYTATELMKRSWANPSSSYNIGRNSREVIENTRNMIAQEINCSPEEIIFTGSASESNALAIDGWLKAHNRNICITTNIEHSSIANNPHTRPDIKVDKYGVVDLDINRHNTPSFYSIQYANSEIGVIQNIKSITEFLHSKGSIVHTDATQAFGHVKIDVKDLDVDMLTATAQKIGGIVGAAFLYVKDGIKLDPIIYGTQENYLRGSTYNVPSIGAFATAISEINYEEESNIFEMRRYLTNELDKHLHDYIDDFNGDFLNRLPNNLSVTFKNVKASQLIELLSDKDIYISAGSACSSYSNKPSRVLKAIGLTDEQCSNTIRITIGKDTIKEDIDTLIRYLLVYISILSE